MRVWRSLRPPLAAAGLLGSQMVHAVYRDDLPSLENQDLSGDFGDPANRRLRFVHLGDSSVTAPGVEDLDMTWPRQVGIYLSDRFHVEVRSVAVGGSKVRDVLEEQLDQALALEPDIVWVTVGSNDALRGIPINRFEHDYHEVVERLHDAVPAVGLSGVGDLGTIPRLPHLARGLARIRARAVNHAIARVGSDFPRAVKSNPWGVMSTAFATEPDTWGEDLFHASDIGHMAFGELAKPIADRLVEIWETYTANSPAG